MKNIVIAIAPFTYTYGPSLAPALLKGCLLDRGIQSKAWDLSAHFNFKYSSHEYYTSVTNWLSFQELSINDDHRNWYDNIIADYAHQIIHEYNADIFCMSVMTMASQTFSESLFLALKQERPDIKIIIGGSGITTFQHHFKKKWYQRILDNQLADTAIINEGEISFVNAILNDIYGVVESPQLTNDELEKIPFANYEDYDFTWYPSEAKSYWRMHGENLPSHATPFLITSSKGCIKSCSFCTVGTHWSMYRVRSGERTAEEIMYLHNEFGATFFNFTDSLINGGLKPFNNMNMVLAERIPNTIKYEGQYLCRGQKAMPERYFEAMALAGCSHVSIGIESGDEDVRNHMGKGITDDDIHYSAEMLHKYGIVQEWNIIAGYPTESKESWEKTMNFVKYWIVRGQGKIIIDPQGTFLAVDGTPLMKPQMAESLQLNTFVNDKPTALMWTTGINKENTFEERANRFLELCNFLIEYDSESYGDYIGQKIAKTRRMLDSYYEQLDFKKNKMI